MKVCELNNDIKISLYENNRFMAQIDDKMKLSGMLGVLRAAGEETRLRILKLLSLSDLTVSDLTSILGQSQPRVSRHLKLLVEAGVADRGREGVFAYFRLTDDKSIRQAVKALLSEIDDTDDIVSRDRVRLDAIRSDRIVAAQRYFADHAEKWNELRTLHVEDKAVETALKAIIKDRVFQSAVDLGTGTGRVLEMIAPQILSGVGIDRNVEMLSLARTALSNAGHTHCHVQQDDILGLSLPSGQQDLVTVHQVLHYLNEPGTAIREAARILRPGGLLIVVDFAPHNEEFLREAHAHIRLGIHDDEMAEWFSASGLSLTNEVRLSGDTDGEQNRLTVTIWVAEKQPIPFLAADASAASSSINERDVSRFSSKQSEAVA